MDGQSGWESSRHLWHPSVCGSARNGVCAAQLLIGGRWLRGLGTRLILVSPYLIALAIAATLPPPTFSGFAWAMLILCILLLTFASTGGGFLLVRAIGLAQPASPRLTFIVATAATRTGTTPRRVYEIEMSVANAFALPVWQAVAVARPALEVMSDEELTAICAHELAHLSESRGVRLLRVVTGAVVFLPFVTARSVLGVWGTNGLIVSVLMMLVVLRVFRRVARRMEERADAAGHTNQGADGTYARALERLYEFNLVPAVMPGKRHPHPHLYDRLLAAGVQPSYARPQPPSNSIRSTAVFAALILAGVLYYVLFVVVSG